MPPYQKSRKNIPCKNFISGRCTKPNCQFIHEKKVVSNTVNTDVLVSMLGLIFEKNSETIFVKEKQLLNLTNLKECPDLQRIQTAVDFNSVGFCNALCQVIREKIVNPEYLMLEENGIKTGFHLFKAIEANDLHISLKGLCLSKNDISTFDSVRILKNFPGLVEVKFDGNPIASDPEYHAKLRKMLPTVLGIDGRGVDRDPLALPWPLQSNHDPEVQLPLLQQLERDMFQALGATKPGVSGVDAVVACYAPNAIFSLSLEDDSDIHTPTTYPKQKRDIPKDFVALRLAQQAMNRNVLKGVRTNRSKLGRLDVCNALKEGVYPDRFIVQHTIDSNADVTVLTSGVKEQLAVITVHGRMEWKHVDQLATDAPTCRLFDRTFVLTAKPGQNIEVTNDMLHLRRVVQAEAILTPFIASRVESLSRRYLLPVEVVQAVIEKVSSDKAPVPEAEMHQSLNAIRRLGGDLWSGCLQASDQAVDLAITVARAVEHYRLSPQAAFHALNEVQGNLKDISNIIGNYDKGQFVVIV